MRVEAPRSHGSAAGGFAASVPPNPYARGVNETLLVALVVLSVYRVTRLLVKDTFPPIAVARARVAERWGDDSWQAYLSSCSWCASPYVGGAVVVTVDQVVGLPVPVLVWIAASAVTGFIAAYDDPTGIVEEA